MTALKDRLRRLGRRETPGLVGRDASRLFSAPVAATAAGPHPAMKAGERPYADTIPADRLAAYRAAAASEFLTSRPGFEPAPGRAPETAPNVIPAAAPDSTLGMPEVLVLRRIRDGLQGLDWAALDAAREQEGATHAAMRRARGQAPFGDYMDRTFRHLALRHPHRGGLNEARVVTLAYPVPGQVADDGDYADVMRRLNQITGTQGWAPRRALTAGGAS